MRSGTIYQTCSRSPVSIKSVLLPPSWSAHLFLILHSSTFFIWLLVCLTFPAQNASVAPITRAIKRCTSPDGTSPFMPSFQSHLLPLPIHTQTLIIYNNLQISQTIISSFYVFIYSILSAQDDFLPCLAEVQLEESGSFCKLTHAVHSQPPQYTVYPYQFLFFIEFNFFCMSVTLPRV